MLQEGIFHTPKTTPPPNFGILFLRVTEGVKAHQVGTFLAQLWGIYQNLKQGRVPGLTGIKVPAGNLNISISYGNEGVFIVGGAKVAATSIGGQVSVPSCGSMRR